MLKTALLPVERTADEWERLRARPDELWTPEVRQLLPMLSRALVTAGIDDPAVPRLMQVARRTWLDNQLLLRQLDAALGVLDAEGIPTIALKGVPLALRHYPDPSLRPMIDFDLLVEADRAGDAVSALRHRNWTVEWELHEDFVRRTSEVPCRSPDGQGMLDLHWRLVPWVGRRWSEPDASLWRRAVPLPVLDHVTLAPADDDLLLHVTLHAYRSGWANVPRWVADACVILRSCGGALDWDRFVSRVVRARLALPVGDALAYVATTFGANVPEPVGAALAGVRPTRRERRKHDRARRAIPGSRHWLLGDGADLRTSWARTSVNHSRAGELRSLGPFLRGRAHVDHLCALPWVVARRRLQRLRTRGCAAPRVGPDRGRCGEP